MRFDGRTSDGSWEKNNNPKKNRLNTIKYDYPTIPLHYDTLTIEYPPNLKIILRLQYITVGRSI